MFSLTVLHHDPIHSPKSSNEQSNNTPTNSTTRRFIVERIKPTCDAYFDFVSTIDTSNTINTSSNTTTSGLSQSIDKTIVFKYHQACALHDHFLVLLKPVNFNLVQKINQRSLSTCLDDQQHDPTSNIQYSLNDISFTVGYLQLNEYLLAENSLEKLETMKNTSRKAKQTLILEISQAASVVELITFQDLNTNQIEQPCLKLQVTVYDPLEVVVANMAKNKARRGSQKLNDLNRLLSRNFENISIQLNHCLSCELDISIIDRLYYIINDVSKGSFGLSSSSNNRNSQQKTKTTKVCI